MKTENLKAAANSKESALIINLSLKIAKTFFLLITIIITAALIAFSTLFFYAKSENFSNNLSTLIKTQINNKIAGKMDWNIFYLSPFKGEFFLSDYKLSLNSDEIISIDKIHITLDIPKMVNYAVSSAIFTDIRNHIKKLGVQKLVLFSNMTEIFKTIDVQKIIANLLINGLIIKDITIEKPQIKLAVNHDNKLNIISAFPILQKNGESENKERPFEFNLPFAIIIDKFNLKYGLFSYKSQLNNLFFTLEDICVAGKSKLKDKDNSELNLSLSMKSKDVQLNGSQTIQLDKHKKGDSALNIVISGKLNDPSLLCKATLLNSKIMGRDIKKASLDLAMDKKDIKIKSLEAGCFDALLRANGNISLAKVFPKGFLEIKTSEQEIKIEDITTNLHITCNNIDIQKIIGYEDGGYQEYPLINSGNFEFMLSKGVLHIKKFDIDSCDSSIKLDGTISYPKNFKIHEQKPVFNLSANSSRLNIVEILKQFNILNSENITATLKAEATLEGSLDNPNISLTADGSNIELMGQKIGSAALKGSYKNHKTVIDSLIVEFPLNTSSTTITNSTTTKTTDAKTIAAAATASASDKLNNNVKENIRSNNNVIKAKGFIDHEQNQKIKVNIFSQGIDLNFIESINNFDVINGVASGSLDIGGSLNDIKSLIIKCDLALKNVKIVDKPFQDFIAKLELKNNRLSINGKLNFDVGADFDFDSKNFDIHGIFNKTELLPWFTFIGVNNTIDNGKLTGTIDIKGNTKNLDKSILENISGKCSLSELSLNTFFIKDKVSIKAYNINGWINGKEFRVEKFKTLLPENGVVTLSSSGHIGGSIKAQADAALPVKSASFFIPNMPDINGSIKLNIDADLKPKVDGINNSKFNAKMEFINIGFAIPAPSFDSSFGGNNLKLHNINGVIKADMDKIEIEQIVGNVGKSGQFRLSTKADLTNFMPQNINAELTAKEININIIEDFTANIDGDLNFKGEFFKKELNNSSNTLKSSSLLSGNIFINNAQWTRDIHVEKTILSTLTDRLIDKKKVRKEVKQKNRVVKEDNSAKINLVKSNSIDIANLLENMKLNIAFKGKKPFIVDNNLAYLEIHPDIKVGGTILSPLISGRSEIDPGIIKYQSTEFTITRGIVDFANPYKIEPELDIRSERKVRDWDITLSVSGTPNNINFKLHSNPKLEDGDIISLLLRGKTVTELISAEGGTTLSAAGMLSQIAASAVSDKVKSATGLDIFEVGFGNSAGNSSSSKNRLGSSVSRSTSTVNTINKSNDNGFEDINVTVGKELTDRISVKYNTENKDGIMVGKTSAEYKFTDNISVSGFQDSEGQFGGEVRYRLEFR